MSKLKILCLPEYEESLRRKSSPVDIINPEVVDLVVDLLETLRTSERPGVGLAAPQVGHNVRIVVIESTGWKNDKDELVGIIPTTVLINPIITKLSEEKDERFEGCLSVPEYNGYVVRSKKIKVTALNEKGATITINTSGFFARVLQHEIDHLDGVLFIDRINDKKKLISTKQTTDDHETEY